MSTRRRAAVACCAVLAMLAAATAATPATADDDDLPSAARTLVPGPNAGAIDPAGDQDWYVLTGGRPEPVSVALATLGSDCGDARLLKIEQDCGEAPTAGCAFRPRRRNAARRPPTSGWRSSRGSGNESAGAPASPALRLGDEDRRAEMSVAVSAGDTTAFPQARGTRRGCARRS